MARADTGTGIAMEVFMKRDQSVPVRIMLEEIVLAKHRPPLIAVVEEDAAQASGEFLGDFP